MDSSISVPEFRTLPEGIEADEEEQDYGEGFSDGEYEDEQSESESEFADEVEEEQELIIDESFDFLSAPSNLSIATVNRKVNADGSETVDIVIEFDVDDDAEQNLSRITKL